jgi:hypothetical protein
VESQTKTGEKMSNNIAIRTRIFSTERLNNSVNGNPRYKLYTEAGVFTTQSDAQLGYQIPNIHIDRDAGTEVVMTATAAARVWKIEVLDSARSHV